MFRSQLARSGRHPHPPTLRAARRAYKLRQRLVGPRARTLLGVRFYGGQRSNGYPESLWYQVTGRGFFRNATDHPPEFALFQTIKVTWGDYKRRWSGMPITPFLAGRNIQHDVPEIGDIVPCRDCFHSKGRGQIWPD